MAEEHKWGQSESEKHETTSIVDQLTEKINTLPPEKVREAEEKIADAIQNKTNPGQILSTVINVLKGVLLVLVVMLSCTGCITWNEEVIDTNKVQREALLNYSKNQSLLHHAQQEAFRQEAYAHVDTKFRYDLEMIVKQAGEDGKVDAKEALDWVKKITAERDVNKASVDDRVEQAKQEVRKAEIDLQTALKLDALIEQYSTQGVSVQIIQQAADQILEIYKDSK